MVMIYRWRSKALRGGHAMAIGRTADEARCRIRIKARQWMVEKDGGYCLIFDDDDPDEIAALYDQLCHDLDAAPDVADVCLLIGGSA